MKYSIKGEWDDEPDEANWIEEYSGYECRALRNPREGYWECYVWLPQTHALCKNGDSYMLQDKFIYQDVDCFGKTKANRYCAAHFCNHPYDMRPLWARRWNGEGRQYRNLDYVKNKCALIAKQLKDVSLDKYFYLQQQLSEELASVNAEFTIIKKRWKK